MELKLIPKPPLPAHITTPAISMLIQQDYLAAIDRLSTLPRESDQVIWVLREMNTLMALLPVALFMEHKKEPFQAVDLTDLRRLEALSVEATAKHGFAFIYASAQLTAYLNGILPGYKAANVGKQNPLAVEHHGHALMAAQRLSNAAKAHAAA